MIAATSIPLVMFEVTDPEELTRAKAQREQFDKNFAWLQPRVSEIYTNNRGKCICIAGQELFVADTGPEAVALARTAHPEDNGFLLRYVPREKMERIYAHLRTLGGK